MNFSIKATIRAFAAPEHRLSCTQSLWQTIVSGLEQRGERRHESGAFLLGVERNGRKEVREAIFYDELDPQAYCTGVCVLHGDAFAKLWARCRAVHLTVVADAHTHPEGAFQSMSDRMNPMVARDGHIAIIIPNFAQGPVHRLALGIYEYRGNHEWHDRGPTKVRDYFYTGFWS